jgi:hypothetical protein
MKSGNSGLLLTVLRGCGLALLIAVLATTIARAEEPEKVEALLPGAKVVRL